MVPLSLFADPERILRRLYVFAEEPCKSTNATSEPCSPVFKEAQPRPSKHSNLEYHINNLNLYLYVFGLFSIFVIKPIQLDCDKIKGISVLLLETPLTRSKYFSPYTHTQCLTRTAGTFCTFAYKQTLQENCYGLLFTFGGKMATSDENWVEQRNKYTYLDQIMIMNVNDVTSVKVIQGKLKGAGKWVDVRRFVKKHKHFNPSGLFELFGVYSVQSADEVRDCLMGWILDNYRSIQSWLRMALEHQNLTLDIWMENMRNPLSHGDDIALYLLCRMYDKHAYVHTAHYGWSTLPLKINKDLDALLSKCDMELVLLDIWLFGEVHKIRKPMITATASTTMVVIPKNVVTPSNETVITGNALKTLPCSVSVKRISSSAAKPAKRTTCS